eukprot:CCRYP_016380-RB/>CCRYP_016380-RB protein AED:0.06 eAED:0.06 QI:166/1/1/1/1/0.75/4/830/275
MSSNSAAFPVLKNAMILQIMAELEIPLTESELVEPGRCRERVREVFSQLLCTCWGLTPAELSSLPTRTLARLSSTNESSPTSISTYPHLYADALVETKFFCLLQKLLKICGYDDFGFRDLSAPTGRRFRRQLSACINFMKYREDMNHLLSTVLEERADMFAALEEVAEEHMILQDHLKELREIHQEKLREKEEAEAECQEVRSLLLEIFILDVVPSYLFTFEHFITYTTRPTIADGSRNSATKQSSVLHSTRKPPPPEICQRTERPNCEPLYRPT